MHVFYTPDISSDTYTLNEEESKHCSRVLRLNLGDVIRLIDGRGGLYEAEISGITKKNVQLKVINKQAEFGKRNHQLHIAIAPTKNIDRLEWFLEKATEIGIDEITPIICDRSERKIVKEERLEKVITSAVKQSLTAYHPKLNPTISFTDLIKQNGDSVKMIAHCMEGEKPYITQITKPSQSYLILIGPEGDFTPAELDIALQNGYKPVTLGNTRLRTETAALAACFEANYINR
ncbi:16S rRNA (uracil(1498)-N(3))-methyltransferase [Pedobacter frigiditerrae]|uniref:Ribosomal RNA small subunit methyltransferase E n=1 Tax=Pedobacter frigiditerrae TaxID=2530452 RepID=A0A4R0N3Z1_9SPHI|nr:16S rRNA (uracil(1498)-N(3))-methyltransferase [Pedobacter frigiditerrae]TCC94087.1 16S rRNA (uracil(1498)-N(3))-methyltransferase [Pedobacter frigiditerrae]